jgi:hypothetical protein
MSAENMVYVFSMVIVHIVMKYMLSVKRKSTWSVKRSTWSVKRSTWSVKRSTWSVKRSTWSVKRSTWSVKRRSTWSKSVWSVWSKKSVKRACIPIYSNINNNLMVRLFVKNLINNISNKLRINLLIYSKIKLKNVFKIKKSLKRLTYFKFGDYFN